jgi:hypothetical protein
MDRPPPDPVRLLEQWMEWERGEETPGRVIANLKTSGMRDLLEHLAALAKDEGGSSGDSGAADSPGDADAEWTPTV